MDMQQLLTSTDLLCLLRSSVFQYPRHQLASCDILWVRMTPGLNCFLNYNDNVLNLALAPVNLAALPWALLSVLPDQDEEPCHDGSSCLPGTPGKRKQQLKNCPHDIALQTYLRGIFLVANRCPGPLRVRPVGPALYEKGGWTWPWERVSKKHSFRV